MSLATAAATSFHASDPKKDILDLVGSAIERIHLNGTDCLCIAYERPEKTAGGIIRPETASVRKEDPIQGIVALLVKFGPQIEDKLDRFGDRLPQIGDWVAVSRGDVFNFHVGKRVGFTVPVTMIRFVLDDPDLVY